MRLLRSWNLRRQARPDGTFGSVVRLPILGFQARHDEEHSLSRWERRVEERRSWREQPDRPCQVTIHVSRTAHWVSLCSALTREVCTRRKASIRHRSNHPARKKRILQSGSAVALLEVSSCQDFLPRKVCTRANQKSIASLFPGFQIGFSPQPWLKSQVTLRGPKHLR